VSANKLNKNDKDFMLWAEWKLGKASNIKAKEIEQTMKDGPEILGTLSPDAGIIYNLFPPSPFFSSFSPPFL
jgi:hypothetical protein